MNDYKTVYTKDYKHIILDRPKKYRAEIRENPLIDPRTETLKFDSYKGPLKPTDEHVSDYFESKFKVKYPHLVKKHFETDLNAEVAEKEERNIYLSSYQVQFCDADEIFKPKREYTFEIEPTTLPSSTYRKSYREPVSIEKRALNRVSKMVRYAEIGTENKSYGILNIVTGQTTYGATIGKLGGDIIEGQIFGEVTHPKCSAMKDCN